MTEENEKNTLEKLNEAFLDFTENTFGESGREFIEKTQKQVNEFNVAAIKAFVEFGDQIIENTKLGENEMVQKSSNTVKDLLRQYNLLEEESEEDF